MTTLLGVNANLFKAILRGTTSGKKVALAGLLLALWKPLIDFPMSSAGPYA